MLEDQCISVFNCKTMFSSQSLCQGCTFVLFFSHAERKLQDGDKIMICMLFTIQMLKSKLLSIIILLETLQKVL